jgi:precorrin-2 dehydrogenase/sirohydrochlorin ferrochelatase
MKYYPLFLKLDGRKAVVVGGGRVAQRKVSTLIRAGAVVEVISPDITTTLREYANKGIIRHRKKRYERGDLKGAFLVIAATSSKETNTRVDRDAEKLVNVVDTPSEGNFIVPSVVRRGLLTVAISTGGSSPALSKAMRKEIEELYGAEFARYLRFVEKTRKEAMVRIRDGRAREKFLKSLASGKILDTVRNSGFDKAMEKYNLKSALDRAAERS